MTDEIDNCNNCKFAFKTKNAFTSVLYSMGLKDKADKLNEQHPIIQCFYDDSMKYVLDPEKKPSWCKKET